MAAAQRHGTEASVCPLQEMPQPPTDSSPSIRTMQKLFIAMAAHSSFHRDCRRQKRLSSHSLHFSLHLSNLTAPNDTLSRLCYVPLFPKDSTESFLLAHVKQKSLSLSPKVYMGLWACTTIHSSSAWVACHDGASNCSPRLTQDTLPCQNLLPSPHPSSNSLFHLIIYLFIYL